MTRELSLAPRSACRADEGVGYEGVRVCGVWTGGEQFHRVCAGCHRGCEWVGSDDSRALIGAALRLGVNSGCESGVYGLSQGVNGVV